MNQHRRIILAAAITLSLAATTGCATKIKASTAQNPAPSQALSYYGRINVKPVAFTAGYKGNTEALGRIQANLNKDLAPSLQTWNSRAANGRTLSVEPVVEDLSFKSTTRRIFLGPFAGSSGILMRVTIRDQDGNIVASPEFFQRAGAMAGGLTFGTMDNLMLMRVSNLASGYLIANYDRAVGGPTGADDKAIAH